MPKTGQSPPTKDPGSWQLEEDKQTPLSLEIHKLQNEVEVYIQKVEELAKRGKSQKWLVYIRPLSYFSKVKLNFATHHNHHSFCMIQHYT